MNPATAAVPGWTWRARLRSAWDRISVYLPVALMGVLALVTYLLARQTPVFGPGDPARPPSSEPDYFLRGFSIKSFGPDGRLKTEITGAEGRHYPDTDILDIDQPRVRAYNARGEPTVATARRGLSNGDGTQVQLIGEAVIVREAGTSETGVVRPRLEIRSEFLHVYTDTERLRTHLPVQLQRGNDRFSADRMEFDHLDQLLQLEGRVRGTLAPRAAAR
jgi:lipopolysaccharide export system protein LptC